MFFRVLALTWLQLAMASIDNPPYLGTLYSESLDPMCWGSLIAPRHFLTSAHCVGKPPAFLHVGTERRLLIEVIVHPQYDIATREYDLAVFKLDRPSRQPTAPLQWAPLDPTQPLTARIGGDSWLIYSPLTIHPNCTGIDTKYDPSAVCAVGNEWVSLCGANSGRPLIVQDQVVAVAGVACSSFPGGQGDSKIITKYALIEAGRPFLEEFLTKDANENPQPIDVRPTRPPRMFSVQEDPKKN